MGEMAGLVAPTEADIRQAVERIRGKAIRTPLVRLYGNGEGIGAEIYLKLENLQPTGAFKVRPASNAIASIKDKEALKRSGVCTASAGNFAQGLAWSCREMGIRCTVVSPDHAPDIKLNAIRSYGAEVIKVPFSEWWEVIESHKCPQAPAGAVFIHPGAENSVLAGNATIALEILQDLPDVDCIVVPYGSGALATGIACGVKALSDNSCKVFAVEPDTAAPFALSMKKGTPCRFGSWQASFVDGCGGKAVLEDVWDLASQVIDGGISVPVPLIAAAVKQLAENNKVIAEGAGAAPVAAAVAGMCGPTVRKIVCVVSGGGLDSRSLSEILKGNVPRPIQSRNGYDSKIEQLGLALPPAPQPKGKYRTVTVVGNMLYISGHGPTLADGTSHMMGRLGEELTLDEAVQGGRLTGLAVLATLRQALGTLDRVKRIVKVLGMVNTNPKVIKHLECVEVVNGFSNLMADVFGDNGVCARSAVGMSALPMNIPVEIEAIFEIEPST
mmetsp:Transcript_41110/g.66210  ORF Transcript_41110/g.66210 Transcript_41110/m.66210 type:complete len:499 (-) Transcript_41110:3553-5049(-)